MNQKQTEHDIKVFLASSEELNFERVCIGDFFNDINSVLADAAVRVRLLKWEHFDPLFTKKRKQSEYDDQVKKADIFVALFRSKVGIFTLEEVQTASDAYKTNGRPQELYCFIHECQEKKLNVDDLKNKLGENYSFDFFVDIAELKLKLLKILEPRLCKHGTNITETGRFIKIESENILRKT